MHALMYVYTHMSMHTHAKVHTYIIRACTYSSNEPWEAARDGYRVVSSWGNGWRHIVGGVDIRPNCVGKVPSFHIIDCKDCLWTRVHMHIHRRIGWKTCKLDTRTWCAHAYMCTWRTCVQDLAQDTFRDGQRWLYVPAQVSLWATWFVNIHTFTMCIMTSCASMWTPPGYVPSHVLVWKDPYLKGCMLYMW